MYYIRVFSFISGLASNYFDYMRFPVHLLLTSTVWQSKPVHLGKPVWAHIIKILVYRWVHYFAEQSEGTV